MTRLVVMGSGETAPTMVRVHRRVFADTGEGPAVLLDTPFAFQMNADELLARTLGYFAQSVGRTVEVVRWPRRDTSTVDQEKALALLSRARWAFGGPGSPTYALRQWRGTPVPAALADVVRRGGTLVLGSAAAVTLGTHSVPVYEIYKVGEDPRWVEGLDVLGTLTGVHAVVVPHYDNSEGGTHDTRFCYLGEQRLARLEAELPAEIGVLGVDEHTALLVDLDDRTATVAGNGAVTVRRRGASREFEQGAVLSLDDLAGLLRGEGGGQPRSTAAGGQVPPPTPAAAPRETDPAAETTLRGAADAARARFDAALAGRRVEECVGAILDLDTAIASWRSDTLQSDDEQHARRVLRALVVRLGELAEVGAQDPRAQVSPYVELLLQLRAAARTAKDFATSDLIRDRLAAAGVEVRDAPAGMEWVLRDAP
jgi:cyanophycinase-like exopeptidase